MNNPYIKQEIKILKIAYIIHTLLFVLLLFSHLCVYLKIKWLSNHIKRIFLAEIIIISIFSFFPIILFIFLRFKTLTEKMIKILKIISEILLYIFAINSIFTSSSLWYNSSLMEIFYRDCPFNYNIDDIPKIFYNFEIENIEKIKKKCNNRRCFPINYNSNIYICNYKENGQNKLFDVSLEDENVKKQVKEYINFCENYTIFYKRERENFKNYDITFNFICPNNSDFIFNYIFTFIFIIADILASSIAWLYELYSYKNILILLIYQLNNNQNINQSLKDTNNTSQIGNNNNQNNNNSVQNNAENFTRQPTQILIVENNNINYLNNIDNINNINNINNNIDNKNKEERIVKIFENQKDEDKNNINKNSINIIKNDNNKSEEQ